MDELVLVVPKNIIDGTFGVDSNGLIQADADRFMDLVRKNHIFMPRNEAEKDENYRQIIAYCVVRFGDEIFITKRLKKQTEVRLHDRRSIGVGGHINPVDLDSDNIVIAGMLRELHEEVFIGDFTYEFLGLINDDNSPVDRVHTGLCVAITPTERACSIRETEKMTGEWMPLSELKNVYDSLEGWSQIVFKDLHRRNCV